MIVAMVIMSVVRAVECRADQLAVRKAFLIDGLVGRTLGCYRV